MVILQLKYNIRPEKAADYGKVVQANIATFLSTPGLVEMQGYRNLTGQTQITIFYMFEDLAGFASWRANESVDKAFNEAWQYIENVEQELLGPSPVMPEPLQSQ